MRLLSERNCTEPIPNLYMLHPPCRSHYSCSYRCNEGFRKRVLADNDLVCEDGQWFLHVTKYDPSMTPETVCVPDGKYAPVTIPVATDAMKDLESVY